MTDEVLIEPIERHADSRGAVFEPLDGDELEGKRNVHVVVTEPGCVRGNHYHPRGTEVLAVAGPARVRWRERGELRDADVPGGEVWRFTIAPGVPHAIQNTGETANLLVAFNTEPHDPADPDVVRETLIP